MGGLFWRLEATSNDLDPDFNRSSLRLSQFFCPNLGDLQKKKQKKNGLQPGSVCLVVITSGPWPLLIANTIGGEAILFSGQKSALKMLKTGYFAYSSGQWGAIAPSSLRYWECSRPRTQAQVFPKIYLKFLRRSRKKSSSKIFFWRSLKKEHKKGLREFSERFLAFSSIMLTDQKNITAFMRTWGFETKGKAKDFKMCPRGLHLCLKYKSNLLLYSL